MDVSVSAQMHKYAYPKAVFCELTAANMQKCYRLLKPNGIFLGISYGSAKSRMHCFLSQEFQWDPVMYTIDRTEAQLGENGLFQDDKQFIIAGPFLPQVIMTLHRMCTCHSTYTIYIQDTCLKCTHNMCTRHCTCSMWIQNVCTACVYRMCA